MIFFLHCISDDEGKQKVNEFLAPYKFIEAQKGSWLVATDRTDIPKMRDEISAAVGEKLQYLTVIQLNGTWATHASPEFAKWLKDHDHFFEVPLPPRPSLWKRLTGWMALS